MADVYMIEKLLGYGKETADVSLRNGWVTPLVADPYASVRAHHCESVISSHASRGHILAEVSRSWRFEAKKRLHERLRKRLYILRND
jgi:hypothetical protein